MRVDDDVVADGSSESVAAGERATFVCFELGCPGGDVCGSYGRNVMF